MTATATQKHVVLLITWGKMERCEIDEPTDWLAYLQRAVGGYIEAVLSDNTSGKGRIVVYGDEEGRLKPHPYANVERWDGTILVGPLVVMGETKDGESRGLTPEEEARVTLQSLGPDRPPLLLIVPNGRPRR